MKIKRDENGQVTEVEIKTPVDSHLHVRDGEMMKLVLPHSAKQFAQAVIMPNLAPPVTTVLMARAYKERILSALQRGSQFRPLMTLYLTDSTARQEIDRASTCEFIVGAKLYPAGATTNSDAGIKSIKGLYPALERMQEKGLVLQIHGEVTDPEIDIFDREAIFIDEVLRPLQNDFPELRIVLEHITTKQGVQYVQSAENIAATITAHHLLIDRNDLFKGGINPHNYCLPIVKRGKHRPYLIRAATGQLAKGSGKFFLGTDSAPHTQANKENACVCAGCFTANIAMELYTQVFDHAGALDNLEKFASLNGPKFYGIEPSSGTITLVREIQVVPEIIVGRGEDTAVVPFWADKELEWTFVGKNED